MSEESYPTLIRPVSGEVKQGWRAKGHRLDGTEVDLSNLAYLELVNPNFGMLAYGKNPAGNFDSWAFRENGGGGAVIVPYVMADGQLLIGVVEQNRPNQGGMVLNVPRGFLQPGETHWNAAGRELEEEVGKFAASFRALPGALMNPNSAFFETTVLGEGVRFYTVEVPSALLVVEGDQLVFQRSALTVDPKKRAAEQITGCRFISSFDALMLSDMFTVAGVGRLLAHLRP